MTELKKFAVSHTLVQKLLLLRVRNGPKNCHLFLISPFPLQLQKTYFCVQRKRNISIFQGEKLLTSNFREFAYEALLKAPKSLGQLVEFRQ